MNAVLLGGGMMSPADPLFGENPAGQRSLIEIHGKPMAQWVLNALADSPLIRKTYVVGLEPGCGLQFSKPLIFLPDAGDLFDNIRAGVLTSAKADPGQTKVLLASSDIPSIRPEMIAWLAEQVQRAPQALVYYNVVTRQTMETRFPNANRSYVQLRDMSVCGGDLNVVDTGLFSVENPIWKKITESRKRPLRQVSFLGLDNLILVALHLYSLEIAVKRISKKLKINTRALVCPYAEMAMDADKPHQLAILRQDLELKK